jgi:hypothetical protein
MSTYAKLKSDLVADQVPMKKTADHESPTVSYCTKDDLLEVL